MKSEQDRKNDSHIHKSIQRWEPVKPCILFSWFIFDHFQFWLDLLSAAAQTNKLVKHLWLGLIQG